MQILINRRVPSPESLTVACIPKLVMGAMGNELYFTASSQLDVLPGWYLWCSNAVKLKNGNIYEVMVERVFIHLLLCSVCLIYMIDSNNPFLAFTDSVSQFYDLCLQSTVKMI